MVVSVSRLVRGYWFFTTEPIIDPPDMMTSTSSTLPYDDEKMRNMIGLVQKAKGTPVLR
jgi:hypothetical protein